MKRMIAMVIAAAASPAAMAQPVDPRAPQMELVVSLDTATGVALTAGEITVMSYTGASPASAEMTGEAAVGTISVLPGRGGVQEAPACRVDFNRDGFVDFFDYDAFITAFEAGDAAADYAADGFVDFFDLDSFIADLDVGC